MCTIFHLLNEYLLTPYHVIDTILGAGGAAEYTIEISYCPGVYIPTGKQDTKEFII